VGESGITQRVALIGCTGLLGDIIGQTVAAQPDLEVVADLPFPEPDLDVDIVLWNNADEVRIAEWLGRISRRRGLRVLATLGDGKNASLWELRPHRTDLGALSPAHLVETIRASRGGRT
jgi:hypothetical protein